MGEAAVDIVAALAGPRDPHPLLKARPPAPRLAGRCTPSWFRRRGVRLMQDCTFLNEVCWLSVNEGFCYGYQPWLAAHLGVCVATLRNMQTRAVKRGLLTVVRTGRNSLLFPNWEAMGFRALSEEVSDQIAKSWRSPSLDSECPEVRLSCSPGSPDLKAAAERVCVPARAASAPPPPRAGATTAAPRDRATEPEQPTGFAADLHAALASFSVLPDPPPTPAPEPTPPQAAQRPEAPATRPEKLGMGPRVHPEVAEPLSRLPDGGDAVRVLAGAALTEEEQRRVLERVLTVHRTQGIKSAGRFMHGQVRDALAARDRKAETAAAEAHDYVPDGGPFPDALRAPPGHLAAPPVRRPPPPRDPLVDRLNHERHRLHHVMSAKHPGRPAQAAIVAELEAQLARRKERRGLHLVPS